MDFQSAMETFAEAWVAANAGAAQVSLYSFHTFVITFSIFFERDQSQVQGELFVNIKTNKNSCFNEKLRQKKYTCNCLRYIRLKLLKIYPVKCRKQKILHTRLHTIF